MDTGKRTLTDTRLYLLLLGVVLAACVVATSAGWWNSATNDEPYFILGAYAAVEGKGLWVVEHPPLYKVAAGISLHFVNLHPAADANREALSQLATHIRAFLHENRVPALTMLRTARLGMLVFLVLLLWGAFRLGELVVGPEVGLAAAFALACQPLILGHAFLVHTDVPAAASWVWATVFLERFLAGRTRAWVGLGVWLGLALAAKHSGVLLFPFFTLRLLAFRLRRRITWKPLVASLVLAWLCVLGLTAWTLRNVTLAQEKELVLAVAAKMSAWPWLARVFLPLVFLSKACAHWFLGLAYVLWNSTHGQGINYFWGAFSPYGFFFYFPLALLAKLSLPFTGLWVTGVAHWRWLTYPLRWLAFYAALYLIASVGSSFNIGARHLLPVVAWLSVLAGWMWTKLGRGVRVAVLAALVASPVVSFPHFISHFSLMVGGPRGGERIFNDSNLDWGQDWARLAHVARVKNWQPLYAVYLGADDPSGYGTPMENLLLTGRLPAAGYVAVSSWTTTVGPQYFIYHNLPENARYLRQLLRFLQRCLTVERVGDTIKVYRCGESTEPLPGPTRPEPTPRQ